MIDPGARHKSLFLAARLTQRATPRNSRRPIADASAAAGVAYPRSLAGVEIAFSGVGVAPEPMFVLRRQPERRLTVVDPVRQRVGNVLGQFQLSALPVARFPVIAGIPRTTYPGGPAPCDVSSRSRSSNRRKGIAVRDESQIVPRSMARRWNVVALGGISGSRAGEYDAKHQREDRRLHFSLQ